MKLTRFAKYAWAVLGFNIIVVLWGAFVRATGSGAGCGAHWPLCNGDVVPRAPAIETIIEFSHRMTSGVAMLMVLGLLIWAFRAYPKGHLLRKAAVWSGVFMILEAAIGAALVLLQYVAFNISIARAFWMMGHLVNTFLLLAVLTLTAWWASGGEAVRIRGRGNINWAIGAALVGTLFLGSSGAVTALGDTLVLAGGISPEESPIVAQLVALRIYHPIIAFGVGGLIFIAALMAYRYAPTDRVKLLAQATGVLYVVQLLLGALNVALKAPVWLQIVHLLMSDLIWIGLVLMAASALAVSVPGPSRAPAAAARVGGISAD